VEVDFSCLKREVSRVEGGKEYVKITTPRRVRDFILKRKVKGGRCEVTVKTGGQGNKIKGRKGFLHVLFTWKSVYKKKMNFGKGKGWGLAEASVGKTVWGRGDCHHRGRHWDWRKKTVGKKKQRGKKEC